MVAAIQEQALVVALQVGAPVLLWGDPGVGKTSTVYAIGQALEENVEVVIAALREPTDFAGLPLLCRKHPPFNREMVARYIASRWDLPPDEVEANFEFWLNLIGAPSTDGGVVKFAPPEWANRLAEKGKGILFLDEISTARPAVQTALLRVVFERVIGDLTLSKDIRIIAAANPPDQIAGGWDLTPPLANRFWHTTWSVDANAWCDGFLYDWPKPKIPQLPQNWRSQLQPAKQSVTAFIRHRPELLLQVPKDEASAGRAWPSPRSWDMATNLYAASLSISADEELTSRLVRGAIGDAPTLEFQKYLEELSLPDPEELLKNPRMTLPTRDDQLYATLGAVVYAVRSNPTAERWNAAWKVLKHGADTSAVDIAVAHAGALVGVRPADARAVPPEAAEFVRLLRKSGEF